MTKYYQLGGMQVPYLSSHLGGTTVAPNGTAVSVVVPTGCAQVYFRAEAAAGYYTLAAGGSASPSSYGYIPANNVDLIFPVDNLGTISVYTGSGGTVHIQYYSD